MDKKLLRAVEKGDAGLLSKLVSSGASVHGVDKKGNSLLHLAALSNSIEACAILIAGGIDPHIRNKKSETAIMLAESKKKKKVEQYLREQMETKSKPAGGATPYAASSATTSAPASGGPRTIQSLVNVLTYDINAAEWIAIAEDTPLTLNFTPDPFGFVLTAPKSDGQLCINDKLDNSFVFSKSTDDFYNYRLGEGPIFGFQFVSDEFSEFCNVMDQVVGWIENPPAPEPTLPPVVPVPPAVPGMAQDTGPPEGGAPPPPPGGGPPPPPPPPAPASPAVPRATGNSLSDMLNAKKENLADSSVEKPAEVAPTGGNMMSELQKRLQRRTVPTESKPEESVSTGSEPSEPVKSTPVVKKPTTPAAKSFVPVQNTASAPRSFGKKTSSASGISATDMELFKNALLDDFRAELGAIKVEIISSLQQEIAIAHNAQ